MQFENQRVDLVGELRAVDSIGARAYQDMVHEGTDGCLECRCGTAQHRLTELIRCRILRLAGREQGLEQDVEHLLLHTALALLDARLQHSHHMITDVIRVLGADRRDKCFEQLPQQLISPLDSALRKHHQHHAGLDYTEGLEDIKDL